MCFTLYKLIIAFLSIISIAIQKVIIVTPTHNSISGYNSQFDHYLLFFKCLGLFVSFRSHIKKKSLLLMFILKFSFEMICKH